MISVPIELVSQGDENTICFSLLLPQSFRARGEVELRLTADGRQSNSLTIEIQ